MVVVVIWLVCFCKVQFRPESCVSFQLKAESTKDEVAFTDCSGIAVEWLGRLGCFPSILNMASDCKHSFLFPFGNMSFTEKYSTETRLQH